MANSPILAVSAYLLISISFVIVNGHPLSPEDVESLLPETPKTKNETVAAIVQDPVIQEAVSNIVGENGTLSGLVVKKNTVILPATEPEVVITHKETILKAPLSHLEDIRKNITETTAKISEKENSEISKVEEISLAQIIPVADKSVHSELGENLENPPVILLAQHSFINNEDSSTNQATRKASEIPIKEKLVVPGIVASEIKLPEGIVPDTIILPAVVHEEISKPLIAVFDEKRKVTLIPTSTESNSDENLLDNLNGPEFGARIIPVAVITSDEQNLETAASDKIDQMMRTRSVPELGKGAENLLAIFTVSEDDNFYNQNEDNDMVAAEDIIFRPLFRYRQQQNDRRRISENRISYQRPSYRRYKPSASSSYDDYNSGKNYRKSQRRGYLNDYYS